jgi:hypothetical protein
MRTERELTEVPNATWWHLFQSTAGEFDIWSAPVTPEGDAAGPLT